MEEERKDKDVEAPEGRETDALEARVQAMDDKRWKLYTVIGGALLGLGVGLSLFVLSGYAEFSNIGVILAAALALLVPRFVENKCKRSISAGRISMIAVIALMMLLELIKIKTGK